MAVCAAYHIPHSVFLGWDQDDRDKAITWHLRQMASCPGCGTRPEEWDPQQGGHRWAYKAEKRRCRGCEIKQQAGESVDPEKDGRGVHVILTRTKWGQRGQQP